MAPADEISQQTSWFAVIREELVSIKQQIAELRGRVNEMRSIQIENCGRDGRNGRNAELRRDCDAMDEAIKTNQKAIQRLMEKQSVHGARLTLLVSASAAVATMVGGAILHYLGG